MAELEQSLCTFCHQMVWQIRNQKQSLEMFIKCVLLPMYPANEQLLQLHSKLATMTQSKVNVETKSLTTGLINNQNNEENRAHLKALVKQLKGHLDGFVMRTSFQDWQKRKTLLSRVLTVLNQFRRVLIQLTNTTHNNTSEIVIWEIIDDIDTLLELKKNSTWFRLLQDNEEETAEMTTTFQELVAEKRCQAAVWTFQNEIAKPLVELDHILITETESILTLTPELCAALCPLSIALSTHCLQWKLN